MKREEELYPPLLSLQEKTFFHNSVDPPNK